MTTSCVEPGAAVIGAVVEPGVVVSVGAAAELDELVVVGAAAELVGATHLVQTVEVEVL